MEKIISYALMLVGLGIIVLKIAFAEILEKIPFIPEIDTLYVIVAGLVLIAGGFFLMKKGPGRQAEEVPIYHGKKIVGYRRR